jgi:hypothetical protein
MWEPRSAVSATLVCTPMLRLSARAGAASPKPSPRDTFPTQAFTRIRTNQRYKPDTQ